MQRNFDFLTNGKYFLYMGITVFILSISCVLYKGLNLGLEFTGGVEIIVRSDVKNVEKILDEIEIINYDLKTNNEFVYIRLSKQELDVEQITNKLKEFPEIKEINSANFIGAVVGSDMIEKSSMALIVALLLILLYVGLRFEFKLAISAVLALVHDVSAILGLLSVTSTEFDLTTLAAILAIIGYSLNDTIVVFDRIRANASIMRNADISYIVNTSINQTLTRTFITSLLTLLVVSALLFWGGEALFSFSFSLALGIVVGTISSIFLATNLILFFGVKKNNIYLITDNN